MSPVESEHTDQDVTPPGIFGRYMRVFISPDTLFRGLRQRPDWVGAMLLGCCLAMAATVLLPPELMIATMREQVLEQGQPFPPELADQMTVIRYGGAVGAFIFWAILMAVFAGLTMLFFAFLAGHEGSYRQYLAVVVHAQLISATSGLLLLPLRIAAEDAQLLLSLGAFAVFLEPGYLLRFLSFLDLFGLWSWVLVGLGVARIGRKESWGGGVVIVLMIPVTMAALFAAFTG